MSTYWYGEGDAKERFQFWLDHPPSAIAIDLETISLKERHPIGMAVAFSPYEAIYFQLHPQLPRELELIKPLLQDIRITKIAHNWMFDMGVIPLIPLPLNIDRCNIFDTNVAARLLGYIETSLHILAPEVGVMATPVDAMLGPKQTMLDLDPMEVAKKCQNDAKVAYRLYLEWKDKIADRFGEYFLTEMAVIPILLDLSLRGLSIDQGARGKLEVELQQDVDFYSKVVKDYGITNPGSNQQIGYMLAKRGNFLPLTRSKKHLSTRVEELEFLDDPMAAAVLGYRKKSKFLNTYVIPIRDDDRFYTEYYLDTLVGRLNSRNRNIQNIPPEARYMFLPDKGLFTTMDYAQEHLYILMHMSGDSQMRKVYEEGMYDGDIHQFTADQMRISRRLAKTLNYAIIYGATIKTISEAAKIKDRHRCGRLLDGWFETFREAAGWIKAIQNEGIRKGWAEPTLFGRQIRLPDESEDAQRRKAVNYPILGSDGEIIKRAIILCNRRGLGPPTMAITVHDSITFDGDVEPPAQELEMIPGFRIPIDIKKTFTWE